MVRLLISIGIFLGSAALGILAAAWLLDDFKVEVRGFLLVVIIYAVVQSIMTPFIAKLAAKNASALLGGTALVATFIGLFVASLFGSALDISGVATWIAGTVIVWLVTAIAGMLIPFILVKAGVQAVRNSNAATGN